jgi:hypothetical protein
LVSGATILGFMAGAFLSMSVGLLAGETILLDRARELIGVVVLIMPVVPLFTTLLLIRGRDSWRLRTLHLLAWGLASVQSFLLVITSALSPGKVWGGWLYIGVAASSVTLEILTLVEGRKSTQG